MQIVTVATPLLLVILALAGGYVFKERADHQEARLDSVVDQLKELAVQIAAKPDRSEINDRLERVESRFERVESQLTALRADLTQIALAVGARTRPQTG